MICNCCGQQIADKSRFCNYCGYKIPLEDNTNKEKDGNQEESNSLNQEVDQKMSDEFLFDEIRRVLFAENDYKHDLEQYIVWGIILGLVVLFPVILMGLVMQSFGIIACGIVLGIVCLWVLKYHLKMDRQKVDRMKEDLNQIIQDYRIPDEIVKAQREMAEKAYKNALIQRELDRNATRSQEGSVWQCGNCQNYKGCRMRFHPPKYCGAFRSKV